ncbi:ubiquitin carboxyl-terminal hydrolase 42-like [Spea bombifrons]|uniref:ubiquitin carboxyl-terminal hydrolase 42-like n=1 Tax=Spea bombifrons TaxID=233779 RepID=UPI0023495E16|nr:ubiquitin carboxyl-terminal hydrolase 42-like [Spea bombifrons]
MFILSSYRLKLFGRWESLREFDALSYRCKQMVTACKRFTIHRTSNVLTLSLKRFASFTGGKLSKEIKYPEYFDIRPYTSNPNGEPIIYDLYGVLVHSGFSCHSGHYFSYVKASNDQRYLMNDSSSTDIRTVLNQQTYLLFYISSHNVYKSVLSYSVGYYSAAIRAFKILFFNIVWHSPEKTKHVNGDHLQKIIVNSNATVKRSSLTSATVNRPSVSLSANKQKITININKLSNHQTKLHKTDFGNKSISSSPATKQIPAHSTSRVCTPLAHKQVPQNTCSAPIVNGKSGGSLRTLVPYGEESSEESEEELKGSKEAPLNGIIEQNGPSPFNNTSSLDGKDVTIAQTKEMSICAAAQNGVHSPSANGITNGLSSYSKETLHCSNGPSKADDLDYHDDSVLPVIEKSLHSTTSSNKPENQSPEENRLQDLGDNATVNQNTAAQSDKPPCVDKTATLRSSREEGKAHGNVNGQVAVIEATFTNSHDWVSSTTHLLPDLQERCPVLKNGHYSANLDEEAFPSTKHIKRGNHPRSERCRSDSSEREKSKSNGHGRSRERKSYSRERKKYDCSRPSHGFDYRHRDNYRSQYSHKDYDRHNHYGRRSRSPDYSRKYDHPKRARSRSHERNHQDRKQRCDNYQNHDYSSSFRNARERPYEERDSRDHRSWWSHHSREKGHEHLYEDRHNRYYIPSVPRRSDGSYERTKNSEDHYHHHYEDTYYRRRQHEDLKSRPKPFERQNGRKRRSSDIEDNCNVEFGVKRKVMRITA